MSSSRIERLIVVCCLVALAGIAAAQPVTPPLPMPGEIGKDVMWIPSDDVMVTRMLDVARVTSRDYLVDLGSGDGRVVIGAARRGARALGIEYNPELVAYARAQAAQSGLGGKARFVEGDLFRTDLIRATVITMFLLEENNLKLRPKLLALRPGTRIVSNSFSMGEWEPDGRQSASVQEGCTSYCEAYLWIVPAKVGGTWSVAGGEMTLKQEFQRVTGTLKTGGSAFAVEGRLVGDRLSFGAGDRRYSGRVSGNAIKGTVKFDGGVSGWNAVRAGR